MFLRDPLFLSVNFPHVLHDNSSLLQLQPQFSPAEDDWLRSRFPLLRHLSEVSEVKLLRWFLSELQAPAPARSDNRDPCLHSLTLDCPIFQIYLGSNLAN